jgi:hypothetical protein
MWFRDVVVQPLIHYVREHLAKPAAIALSKAGAKCLDGFLSSRICSALDEMVRCFN